MNRRLLIVGLLLVPLVLFLTGCTRNESEEAVSSNQSSANLTVALEEGSSAVLGNWNVTVEDIKVKTEYVDGTCNVTDERAKVTVVFGNTSIRRWMTVGDSMTLPDGSTLALSDIQEIVEKEETPWSVGSKKVVFTVTVPVYDSHIKTLSKGEHYLLDDGRELSLKDIGIHAEYFPPTDLTRTMDEGDRVSYSSDLEVYLRSVTENIVTDSTTVVNVTRGEGQQVSLPGDYAVRIINITQTVGTPDHETEVDEYEEGDSFELSEGTSVSVMEIHVDVTNCSEGCSITNESVELRIYPEGSRSYHTYILGEGDSINASDRVVLTVQSIDETTSCENETCVVSNKSVRIRSVVYASECPVSDREVELELLFPDLSTETVTLGYGEEYSFITGEKVKVLSITEDVSDSVAGSCTVSDETVTLQITLITKKCDVANKRVNLRITWHGEDYSVSLDEGSNKTLSTPYGDLFVEVPEIDVSVEQDDDRCSVDEESATVHISSPARCEVEKDSATLEINGTTLYLDYGDTHGFGGTLFTLEDIIYDVSPVEKSGRTICELSNVKARLRIQVPTTQTISIDEGDEGNVDDLMIRVDGVNYSIVGNCTAGNCSVGPNTTADITVVLGDDNRTATVYPGYTFVMGSYTVTVQNVSVEIVGGETTCNVKEARAVLSLVNTSANLSVQSGNESED